MASKAPIKTLKGTSKSEFKDKEKPAQIRNSNIVAAKGMEFSLYYLVKYDENNVDRSFI